MQHFSFLSNIFDIDYYCVDATNSYDFKYTHPASQARPIPLKTIQNFLKNYYK